MERILVILLLLVLTVASGFGDSRGFIYADRIWDDGQLKWVELGKSAAGFASGIILFWIALRVLQSLREVSPEVQTLGWFGVTMVGVAMTSGAFAKWTLLDQLVAVAVVGGIGVLFYRTGA